MTYSEQFENTVLQTIRDKNLISKNDKIIVAVSGGADSMSLLVFLLKYSFLFDISIEVVHVDHGIRGDSSKSDANFVKDFCTNNNIPIHLYTARDYDIDYPENPSEEWARQLRYGFFEKLLIDSNIKIATAHTLNDQAETLLFRLARGTSVNGAGGIKYKRGQYIRPLLNIDRELIENYCTENNISYVTDETNLSDNYSRNKIRHYAIPILKNINSNSLQSIGKFCDKMQKTSEYLSIKANECLSESKELYGWSTKKLLNNDTIILEEALISIIKQEHEADDKTLQLVMNIVKNNSGSVQLSSKKGLRIRKGILEWFNVNNKYELIDPVKLSLGKHIFPGNFVVNIEILSYEDFINSVIDKSELKFYADYEKVFNLNPIIRTYKSGDKIRPKGRGITKQLRKYYWELNIPADIRNNIPLIASDSNALWVYNQGFADGFDPIVGRNVLKVK